MKTVELVTENVERFYKEIKNDKNARYKSWEHCYLVFRAARKDKDVDHDYLSLNLAFYLASWGMYRASSFLFHKDYKVHIDIVEELLKEEYDDLVDMKCDGYSKNNCWAKIGKLYSFIEKHYSKVRKTTKGHEKVKTPVSEILITKVLMGTLGCVPAYDEYFKKGVKKENVAPGCFGKNSLDEIVKFYLRNKEELESVRKTMKVGRYYYPQMKLLDMAFWEIGINKK